MYALTGSKWKNCYLDYWLGEGCVRIEVVAMANVAAAGDLYFKRSCNFRSLWEYLKEIGVKAVFNKVLSRFAERFRNEKFYSIGLGRVIETLSDSVRQGEYAVFAAPVFPRACERIVLPEILIKRTSAELVEKFKKNNKLLYFSSVNDDLILPELYGWQAESGIVPNKDSVKEYLHSIEEYWSKKTNSGGKYFKLSEENQIQMEKRVSLVRDVDNKQAAKSHLNAALFGLGNYAKTQILPNLDQRIKVHEIHETDPMQIGSINNFDCDLSSSPEFESSMDCSVFFIASYHHTHADLAIKAIESGFTAVVEKPVVTSQEQLYRLMTCDARFPGKLFSCYHMRYNPLFRQALQDLKTSEEDAVHITADVYEVALPKLHWYRWPNSQSHIVSNGCHWIDLFLFANNYSRPVKTHLELMKNGDSVSFAELENGACLCLHLTHLGSPRIGVQDHVVMRSGSDTATIINGSEYRYEDAICLKRRLKYNRMGAYKEMYKAISAAIAAGEKGDSANMIMFTNEVVLELNEIYNRKSGE